jgi:polysaccharide export outer membrane protein
MAYPCWMKRTTRLFVIGLGLCLIFWPVIASAQGEKGQTAEGGTLPPNTDQYIIGPEDVLHIQVWREEQLSQSVMVRSDGMISLPLLDDIKAAGLTPLQLKELLTEKYKKFIEMPIVTVMVREARSFKVFVGGQVVKPGVYTLVKEISILQLIPLAGGFTQWANPKKILVIRNEDGKEKRFTINYKRIVEGKDGEANIMLKPGDTVIVPD